MGSRQKYNLKWLLLLLAVVSLPITLASDDYIAPEEFLSRVFAGVLPKSDTVWVTGDKLAAAKEILGHNPSFLRMRYWGDDERSAWIVDEIGKTEPITIGVVISNNQIEEIKVLAFRESRGWEIKYDFFTRQFKGAGIHPRQQLDRRIDGISGATLSVKAMTRVSRLVLYLAKSLST